MVGVYAFNAGEAGKWKFIRYGNNRPKRCSILPSLARQNRKVNEIEINEYESIMQPSQTLHLSIFAQFVVALVNFVPNLQSLGNTDTE
jgi:hypothetical protein